MPSHGRTSAVHFQLDGDSGDEADSAPGPSSPPVNVASMAAAPLHPLSSGRGDSPHFPEPSSLSPRSPETSGDQQV
jgi:hypothetical protein